MGEEEEEHHLSDGLCFIIDPIDGTTNYMRHRRSSMISVGLVENGKAVQGALYDPYRDELYHAARGQGAWCNDNRLQVSDFPPEKGLVMFGTAPYRQDLAEVTCRSALAMLRLCGDLRRSGSACVDLCDVAAGRAEAMFEWISMPWDYCAASVLVTEAGGRMGSILSDELPMDHPTPILAAVPRAYDRLRAALLEARNG